MVVIHEIWYNKCTGFDDPPQFQGNQRTPNIRENKEHLPTT